MLDADWIHGANFWELNNLTETVKVFSISHFSNAMKTSDILALYLSDTWLFHIIPASFFKIIKIYQQLENENKSKGKTCCV